MLEGIVVDKAGATKSSDTKVTPFAKDSQFYKQLYGKEQLGLSNSCGIYQQVKSFVYNLFGGKR